jgi:hypothetical protein
VLECEGGGKGGTAETLEEFVESVGPQTHNDVVFCWNIAQGGGHGGGEGNLEEVMNNFGESESFLVEEKKKLGEKKDELLVICDLVLPLFTFKLFFGGFRSFYALLSLERYSAAYADPTNGIVFRIAIFDIFDLHLGFEASNSTVQLLELYGEHIVPAVVTPAATAVSVEQGRGGRRAVGGGGKGEGGRSNGVGVR